MPNVLGSLTSDEAHIGERISCGERTKSPVHEGLDLFLDGVAQKYVRVEMDVCWYIMLEETVIKSIKPKQAFWWKLLEYFFGCGT